MDALLRVARATGRGRVYLYYILYILLILRRRASRFSFTVSSFKALYYVVGAVIMPLNA